MGLTPPERRHDYRSKRRQPHDSGRDYGDQQGPKKRDPPHPQPEVVQAERSPALPGTSIAGDDQ